MNCIREYLRRRGYRLYAVWVAELQERGAVHYHLVLWLPRGVTIPKPDKRGWWAHGTTRIEWARRPVGYLVKYASKAHPQHHFPKNCRIHAALGLDKLQRMERRWWRAPRYVRERWPEWNADVRRAAGGGFLSKLSREWMDSAFHLVGFMKGGVEIRAKEYPSPERCSGLS